MPIVRPSCKRRVLFSYSSTQPDEAVSFDDLPDTPEWQFEPKWDGFRCLAFKAGREVELRAKSDKPLGRYFPEMVAIFAVLPEEIFVIDGELVIEMDGRLSFGSLQMRLHPAESRIRKLSLATLAHQRRTHQFNPSAGYTDQRFKVV